MKKSLKQWLIMKKIIHKTQDKILSFFIGEKRKRKSEKLIPKGINSAESIAVLFELNNENELNEAKIIHKELKKNIKKVRFLGFYIKEKNTEEITSFLDFDFIHHREFNLKGRILSGPINTFCEKQFNILINLCSSENLRMHIVSQKSKSDFKIGFSSSKTNFIYDLIIEDSIAQNIKEKFNKLYPILQMINPENKNEKI